MKYSKVKAYMRYRLKKERENELVKVYPKMSDVYLLKILI